MTPQMRTSKLSEALFCQNPKAVEPDVRPLGADGAYPFLASLLDCRVRATCPDLNFVSVELTITVNVLPLADHNETSFHDKCSWGSG
jgi:hypothetical protein